MKSADRKMKVLRGASKRINWKQRKSNNARQDGGSNKQMHKRFSVISPTGCFNFSRRGSDRRIRPRKTTRQRWAKTLVGYSSMHCRVRGGIGPIISAPPSRKNGWLPFADSDSLASKRRMIQDIRNDFIYRAFIHRCWTEKLGLTSLSSGMGRA